MKKLNFIFAILFGAALFAFAPGSANAQLGGTSPFIKYSNNIFVNSNMHLFFQKRWQIARLRAAGKHQVADALEGRASSRASSQNIQVSNRSENALRRVPLSETSFKRSNLNIFKTSVGAQLVDKNASQEEKETLFSAMDELLKSYDQMLVEQKETRLKNNVAAAAAFAIVMSRSVLTGGELSEKQTEGLLQDINSLLASSEKFKNLSNAQKQQMYEAFVITAGLAALLNQIGIEKSDNEMIGQGKELAKAILSQFFNRPIEEIKFTGEGVQFN